MKGSLNAGPGADAGETAAFAAVRAELTSDAWGEGDVAAHLLTRSQNPSAASCHRLCRTFSLCFRARRVFGRPDWVKYRANLRAKVRAKLRAKSVSQKVKTGFWKDPNALVLKKTPVENAPRTSIAKHLSLSSDIPPAEQFPPHRSRAAGYPPNRQPATVSAEERGWRGTTSCRMTTGEVPELSPPKSACDGDAVFHTSTRGTVPMGQCAGCHRGQHLTVKISTNDLHC
jgi:hypothetical protein